MKNLVRIPSNEVFDYWRKLENCSASSPLRPDILDNTFPAPTEWFTANIEEVDIQETLMLPVRDFGPLSKNSWQLRSAVDYFAQTFADGSYDPGHPYNADKMRQLLSWPGRHTSRVIMVSDNQAGPFTILDGNHRAVLLMHEGAIIGASVYLGLHSAVRQFNWAKRSYERNN